MSRLNVMFISIEAALGTDFDKISRWERNTQQLYFKQQTDKNVLPVQ